MIKVFSKVSYIMALIGSILALGLSVTWIIVLEGRFKIGDFEQEMKFMILFGQSIRGLTILDLIGAAAAAVLSFFRKRARVVSIIAAVVSVPHLINGLKLAPLCSREGNYSLMWNGNIWDIEVSMLLIALTSILIIKHSDNHIYGGRACFKQREKSCQNRVVEIIKNKRSSALRLFLCEKFDNQNSLSYFLFLKEKSVKFLTICTRCSIIEID